MYIDKTEGEEDDRRLDRLVMYEVWLKSNGTGRPADMVEDPQTSETHDINLQHIAMMRAKRQPATAIALLYRAPFVHHV